MRPVVVGESPPNPILEVDFSRTRADSGQRLVLTEKHILVKDVDTVLGDDTLDASKIRLRVSGLQGGSLELLDSSLGHWVSIKKTVVNGGSPDYYAFTLADLEAGKIGLLVGDGVARAKGGDGTKVAFQIQAADDGIPGDLASDPNLSDFDRSTSDLDPVDVEILVFPSAEVMAGLRMLVNADAFLTPNDATLRAWLQTASTHDGATLHVVVKLVGKQGGDVLSLRSGYNESKIGPDWDKSAEELSIKFADDTTILEMKTALKLLELDTDSATSTTTRRVWVFPTLKGIDNLVYRFDGTAGLVRYYWYSNVRGYVAAASTAVSERVLFGKPGYLGVPTSTPEKGIYESFGSYAMRLAIEDSETEGKWLVTSGPQRRTAFLG